MTTGPVQQGKKKREELRLPELTFVVADDWIDKLGYESFALWLKLHSWVDRTDSVREYDRIPRSFENIYEKKLGISKSKFYRLIKPLWEFWLIDIVEYEASLRKTQKPKNIIVYEYPLHEIMRKYQPLEKLRDWDKDYESVSKELGKTGGRPRKKEKTEDELPEKKKKKFRLVRDKNLSTYRFKIETLDRFKNKTVDRFKNKTVTVSKLKPNNYSNISINLSNSFNNVSNFLLMDDEETKNEPCGQIIKRTIIFSKPETQEAYQFVNSFTVKMLREDLKVDKTFEERTICYLWKAGLSIVYLHEFRTQFKKIFKYENSKKGKMEPIRDRALYLVNGIVMNRVALHDENNTYKTLEGIEEKKKKEEIDEFKSEDAVPFYNWLEQ